MGMSFYHGRTAFGVLPPVTEAPMAMLWPRPHHTPLRRTTAVPSQQQSHGVSLPWSEHIALIAKVTLK